MTAIRAIWKKGRIVLEGEADWPEGCRLIVQEDALPAIEFMAESEQGDDPASIQQWIDELRASPAPPAPGAEEEADWKAWEETMRHHNVKQFASSSKTARDDTAISPRYRSRSGFCFCRSAIAPS
jgi:hypothetical protein